MISKPTCLPRSVSTIGFFPVRSISATHDTGLAVRAIDHLKRNNMDVELELLYGLPMSDIVRTVAERNIPIRIYVPYGEA